MGGLCAIAQAESLRYKLIGGLAVRRACCGVLRFIMESGAKGCEVVVSGKLRGQRAKSMKFVDGLGLHSGDPVNDYVDSACRHVLLRQGVLGIKVRSCCPSTPLARLGPRSLCQTMCPLWSPRRKPCHQTPSQRPRLSSLTRRLDLLFEQPPLYNDQPFSCAVLKHLKELFEP